MRVYRLEFVQPDGRWTGPYCAEWLTARAFAQRELMIHEHCDDVDHPHPDGAIFRASGGPDRYVCAMLSPGELFAWFGRFFDLLWNEGAHLGVYDVPLTAVAHHEAGQVVYMQRLATSVARVGCERQPARDALKFHRHPSVLR